MPDNTIGDVPANTWTSAVDPSSAAAAAKKKSAGIDMQGFLKLMAAQMQNQSLTSSSTDNSQYITQMTLFTAIQAMNTQTSEANKQYASSLIGNDVLIKTIDKTTGKPTLFTGTVSKAIFNSSDGDSVIQIGDKTYGLSDIAEVYGPHGTQTAADREYAASLVGKAVSVRTVGSDGVAHSETGTIQNASFDPATGASTITLTDGHTFNISDVTGVTSATDREYAASLVGQTVVARTDETGGIIGKVLYTTFDHITGETTLTINSNTGNHTVNVSDVEQILSPSLTQQT